MKKLIIVVVMFMIGGCAGMQPAPDANKPIEFVLDAPGKTQAQLFSSTKSWIAETFVSAKAVIDDADKDSGRIIAKGRIKHPCDKGVGCLMGASIGFVMRIDTKDGKIRTTYTSLTKILPATYGAGGSPESETAIWAAGDLVDAKTALKDLSDSLQHYVVSDSSENKNF